MFLHVAFHWADPGSPAEGFSDVVLNVPRAPAQPADIDALKEMIATPNRLMPSYITIITWNALGGSTP